MRIVTKNVKRLAWVVLPAVALLLCADVSPAAEPSGGEKERTVQSVTAGGLEWLAAQQWPKRGCWMDTQRRYPAAMTALAGMALLCEGSTTSQGKYARNIDRAVDYLIANSRDNGLIGDPARDNRYTYGHGFSMLFLSQVLGEEGDAVRREQLVDVLTKAAIFSGQAQAESGGWGYVSAKDRSNFDEGSTTITQVQGLRGCRNAGIPVPKEVIDKAIAYIHRCTLPDGGVQYSSNGGGGRPAITAAAIACLYNAGQYDDDYVPKQMKFCQGKLNNLSGSGFGHWHYAHYYYAQVMYREGGQTWKVYSVGVESDPNDKGIFGKLVAEAAVSDSTGQAYWPQGYIGPVYTTAIALTILQLPEGTLPIYQR